eukprot:TRINITY_DN28308_c0_g1_i1.p1 TRINITY_DN28308_c0_g1~~TRINITY_DN28308_c0_g1_i1.p1  ORF type:complete len:224 (-),score=57.02 TRINITY_DN28308_c0_g1_i1:57-701(-)
MGPSRVLLLRHGNTSKAAVDSARQLTEKGRAQCLQLAERFGSKLGGVQRCFASPTLRALETARLVMGKQDVRELPELYFEPRSAAMRAADRDLGYSPLRDFLSKYPGLYDPWTQRATEAVKSAWQGESAILLVGHHTYISLVAHQLLKDDWVKRAPGVEETSFKEEGTSLLLGVNLGEASGFELDGVQGIVSHLESPVETDFSRFSSNDAYTET